MSAIACMVLLTPMVLPPPRTVDAVTFDSEPREVYLTVREVAETFGWSLSFDPVVELVEIKGHTLDPFLPRLSDGTFLIPATEVVKLGAAMTGNQIRVSGRVLRYSVGKKRVAVDLKSQILKAWQGGRLIYEWPVSSGREGKETPNGDFRALGKEAMHISSIYGSPMPFSVHVTGNIFIHGSAGFSGSPGSHGCIRLPLMSRRNAAEEFFNWIEVGSPITIRGAYRFQKQDTGK